MKLGRESTEVGAVPSHDAFAGDVDGATAAASRSPTPPSPVPRAPGLEDRDPLLVPARHR
jgi:hypothetical protein